LEGVEDRTEATPRFGSWSNVYIKLGVLSVWDCFNINFPLKSDSNCVCKCLEYEVHLLMFIMTVSVNQE
jgi:hypothetical protein